MKKETISIQFNLPGGGGGLKQIEVELPEGAYDIKARPQSDITTVYISGKGGGAGTIAEEGGKPCMGGGTQAGAGGFSINANMGGTPK